MSYVSITSPSNPRIKFAASLRSARDRKRAGKIVIDGVELIAHAQAGGVRCEEIFVAESYLTADRDDARCDPSVRAKVDAVLANATGARVYSVAATAMAKLQYGERDVDAIAIAQAPNVDLSTLHLPNDPGAQALFLVLDRIEKPGNLGAMLRSADAAGVTGVLVGDPVCEVFNPNAIRSSLGTIFRVPLAIDTAQNVERWLRDQGISVFPARADGGETYSAISYPPKVAIVIGNEAHGLQERWAGTQMVSIHIPMRGAIDSLNASVTGALLLFEVVRQSKNA